MYREGVKRALEDNPRLPVGRRGKEGPGLEPGKFIAPHGLAGIKNGQPAMALLFTEPELVNVQERRIEDRFLRRPGRQQIIPAPYFRSILQPTFHFPVLIFRSGLDGVLPQHL